MKTIEEFRAEQQKALEAHTKRLARGEAFAAAGFQIPEYIAEGKTHGALHVVYRNSVINTHRSMADAVEMFANFAKSGAVVAQHVMQDGAFTTCHPEKHMPPKRNGNNPYVVDPMHSSPYAVCMGVRHMGENRNTSATLDFFAMVAGELYKVSIEFGTGYIGNCPKLAPSVSEERDHTGRRIISRRYLPNTDARAFSDHYLSYSYGGGGPVAEGADHRFLFVADYDDDTQPADCSHAIAQLENLASIVDGVTK